MENSNLSNGRKILIVTDAWDQVNGVVTTLTNLIKQLERIGHTVQVLSHTDCKYKCQMPLYPEVTLAWANKQLLEKKIHWADSIHISTPEGPVGFKAMRYCVSIAKKFTTGYHTKWPEFVRARVPLPEWITYRYMCWLHKHSSAVLVPTPTVKTELEQQGFSNVKVWTRGVNRDIFSPKLRNSLELVGHPILLCVSRVSQEKGLDEFCKLNWPSRHTKFLVGDGPYLETLKKRYPEVIFPGMLHGIELARYYASADVFVFPSKADTFGVVMIESMASGTPVAAYPVTGPIDVIDQNTTGYMHEKLESAVEQCLLLDREQVEKVSRKWTWENCAKQFVDYLA